MTLFGKRLSGVVGFATAGFAVDGAYLVPRVYPWELHNRFQGLFPLMRAARLMFTAAGTGERFLFLPRPGNLVVPILLNI